jgi:hypothetical protein
MSALHILQTTVSWFSGIALMAFIVILSIGFSKLITWVIITLWKLYSSLSMGSHFFSTQDMLRIKSRLFDRWKRRPKPINPLEIANRALRRVHKVTRTRGIQLLDIGLLSYDGGAQPNVSRTETIPAYTIGLRPFVVINVSEKRDLHFTLKLALTDETEQLRFASEVRDYFRHGRNYFTPSKYLRMVSGEMGGNWSLRVSIDEQPFAQHDFAIAPDVGVGFRPYLHPDGEIDEWLTEAATQTTIDSLSLTDLLGDQDSQAYESRSR